MGKSKALPALYITVAQMIVMLQSTYPSYVIGQFVEGYLRKCHSGILPLHHAYSYFAWYVSASEGFVKYTAASIFQL